MRNDVLNLTNPMEESELEQILGGGDGVFRTISHECNMNTWQFIFTAVTGSGLPRFGKLRVKH